MYVSLNNGIKLYYEEYGNKNGDAILFLHGNEENNEIFNFFKDKLQKYHLYFIDSRCHGNSSYGTLSYDEMSLDIRLFINSLGIKKPHIVGFSDGAIIAIKLALIYPQLGKLFLIGPNIDPSGLTVDAIIELRKENSIYSNLCLNEPHIKESELSNIKSRSIIIGGEFDMIESSHLELIKNNIPNSTLYILKGLDHFVIKEDPIKILSIIENELSINVFYEDNHIIVVEKKAGILSQEDKTKDPDILSLTKSYLKIKYEKPGNVYLGLVQRLDRNVSGLMVFAKTSKASARLNENRPIKNYLAVVYGKMKDDKGTLVNHLLKDENKLIAYPSEDGKLSILHYETLKTNDNYSLLDVRIDTGRFHQIRCQLSLSGHSIYNDYKYNKNIEKNDYSIALDAYKVSFLHPIFKEIITISRYPEDEIFSSFDTIK